MPPVPCSTTDTHRDLGFPRLASACPKLWTEMRGDERTRFCDVCGMYVHNLSALTADERASLLENAQGRLCAGYLRRLNGKFVTPETPLSKRERRGVRQFGVMALSGAALALAAGCVAPPTSTANPTPAPVATGENETMPTSAAGDEDVIVMMTLGMVACDPSGPARHTPPPKFGGPR